MLRDGAQKEIEAAELVVGDIVYIKGGDKTPADIRMIVCHSIKVTDMPTEQLLSCGVSNEGGQLVPHWRERPCRPAP